MAVDNTILIVEDEPVQQKMIAMLLEKKLGYATATALHGKEALDMLQSHPIDTFSAVLLDINMPVMDGFATLKQLRLHYPALPVIILTAVDDTATAVRAIKEGAFDFIAKPPDPTHLEVTLANARRMRHMAGELARLKRDKQGTLTFADLVGHTGGLAATVVYGRKAANSDVPVFLSGETGSGKELFARAIHGESRRADKPFIAINCGALPVNLIESTLFGHEKGAFTGAIARTPGKFREAEGGTVFLDEVSELPLDAQVKLLRVLQQQEVEPVGAARPVKINVRIISATHRDLKQDVASGRFREDLYFRLHVLPVALPPLRARAQDIVPLAEYFIRRFADTDRLPTKTLAADAKDYLLQQHWPGNVRELENLIRRALVLSENEILRQADLAAVHDARAAAHIPIASGLSVALQNADGTPKTLDALEQEIIRRTLDHCEQNITRAAEVLGIAKSTFYRKVKAIC